MPSLSWKRGDRFFKASFYFFFHFCLYETQASSVRSRLEIFLKRQRRASGVLRQSLHRKSNTLGYPLKNNHNNNNSLIFCETSTENRKVSLGF